MDEPSPSSKPSSLAISTNDRWFTKLLVVAARSQFTGHNLYLWEQHIQANLRPRELVDHLTDIAPPKTDPHYKRWTLEEEVQYTWILDSMSTEMANRFIEYATVKEIWNAVYYFHSKKNDCSKIA